MFGEADYLPHLAFPFAKLFQNNRLLAFEMLATILSKCRTTLVVLFDQVLPSTAVALSRHYLRTHVCADLHTTLPANLPFFFTAVYPRPLTLHVLHSVLVSLLLA